jgi:hypothetical protein
MRPPTVDRDGRDALVELMGHRFFAQEDGGPGAPHGDDEEPIRQFRDDLQLMTDLAWLPRRWLVELQWPEADLAEFTFSLEPRRLRRALRRAARYAEETCRTDPDLDEVRRQQFERAQETCSRIVEDLDRDGGDR